MTPEAAEAVLGVVEESGNGSDLDPQKRQFVERYLNGPNAGNGTQCALEVHPEWNYNRAAVEASLMLRDVKVREYLVELRRRAMEGLAEALKPWMPLAVKAQRKLENHLDGVERLTGTDLAVIREILDRACGRAKETLEFDSGDRITKLIMELAGQRPSRYVRPEPRELLPAAATPENGRGE